MADNVAITAGTGTTVATDEVGGVHYQRVKVAHGADGAATDVSTSSPLPVGGAAADDAAAAGNPLPIGGVYQATVDEVDDGDVGRLRMSARRAMLAAADYFKIIANSSSVALAGDMRVSTVNSFSGYAAPTVAFFDGSDPGFDANVRFIQIPMASNGYREATIQLQNSLGVAVNVVVAATLSTILGGGAYLGLASSVSVENGVTMIFTSHDLSTGSSGFVQVMGLAGCYDSLILAITPASDPSEGGFTVVALRRT